MIQLKEKSLDQWGHNLKAKKEFDHFPQDTTKWCVIQKRSDGKFGVKAR